MKKFLPFVILLCLVICGLGLFIFVGKQEEVVKEPVVDQDFLDNYHEVENGELGPMYFPEGTVVEDWDSEEYTNIEGPTPLDKTEIETENDTCFYSTKGSDSYLRITCETFKGKSLKELESFVVNEQEYANSARVSFNTEEGYVFINETGDSSDVKAISHSGVNTFTLKFDGQEISGEFTIEEAN